MDFLNLNWIAFLLGGLMCARALIRNLLIPGVYEALPHLFLKVFSCLQSEVSIIIEEFDASYNNDTYNAVETYLSSKCFSSVKVVKLSKSKNTKNLRYTMADGQKFEETYMNFKLKWSFHSVENNSFYALSFHRKIKELVHFSYLPYIFQEASLIRLQNKERWLYTNHSHEDDQRLWYRIPFLHPSTLDTLAMDPLLKREIKEDLLKFVKRQVYYNRVGRAWKRGYLLYGPPGTGKTSLIAAISNFLEYDIYDLELTVVKNNSQLRKLLFSTSRKSIIVVEDVDCSLDLLDRDDERGRMGKRTSRSNVNLSGVLNFVDGLWSSCGEEKIIIFTTNYKENLDPAFLRAGRMDKQINLSYCEIAAFKALAKNYLDVDEKHELMKQVEKCLPRAKMTLVDVAEVFMGCKDDSMRGMSDVVQAMKKRLGIESIDMS